MSNRFYAEIEFLVVDGQDAPVGPLHGSFDLEDAILSVESDQSAEYVWWDQSAAVVLLNVSFMEQVC